MSNFTKSIKLTGGGWHGKRPQCLWVASTVTIYDVSCTRVIIQARKQYIASCVVCLTSSHSTPLCPLETLTDTVLPGYLQIFLRLPQFPPLGNVHILRHNAQRAPYRAADREYLRSVFRSFFPALPLRCKDFKSFQYPPSHLKVMAFKSYYSAYILYFHQLRAQVVYFHRYMGLVLLKIIVYTMEIRCQRINLYGEVRSRTNKVKPIDYSPELPQ